MKGVVMTVALTLAFGAIAFQRTPEEAAKLKARRAAVLAAKGGLVTKPQSGNFLRIINQSSIETSVFKGLADDLNSGLNVGMLVEDGKAGVSALKDAAAAVKTPKTGAVLLVVEDDSLPALLGAPEDAWAILNVAKLDDDMPPKTVYDLRLRKEFNRGVATVFNAGQSLNKPDVMDPVYKKTDLDSIKMLVASPETLSKMIDACNKLGIEARRIATYKQAALEGWAPAPTNDVQRAIIEEVKNPSKKFEQDFPGLKASK